MLCLKHAIWVLYCVFLTNPFPKKLTSNMKIRNIVSYIFLTSLLFVSTSCNKWLDINDDPTGTLNPTLPTLMTSAGVRLGFTMGSDISRYSLILSQQFAGQGAAGTQNKDYMGYLIQPTDVNNVFRTAFFAGILNDLEAIIALAKTSNPRYAGIAKVMKAHTFQVMVDAWGDLPYSEAFKGIENTQPKYDDDAAIYTAINTLLDEAIADLRVSTTVSGPGADDVVYTGNIDRWIRLAHTLQLRIALRYADKVAKIDALLAKTNAVFMRDNNDAYQVRFGATAGNENPIHQFEIRRLDQYFPSTTLVNIMNTKNDPRRRWFFTPNATGAFVGAPNDRNSAQSTAFSRLHVYLRGDSTGTTTTAARGRVDSYTGAGAIRMMTYPEYCFIRAEYEFAKGSTPNAQTWYQTGIIASLRSVGASETSIITYLGANGTLNSGTELRQIIEEKYVAAYGVAMEPWTDWRRTGFPVLTPAANNVTNNIIPRVLPYSQQETDSNPNTPARPNITTKTVFWDL
ncbi:MAG: SusD/RagB family nutrient-binding outer membrane lipoprotein [Bacteroidetes bacterium]|nr:MAG: SusD/RagB family nutrient-binding outer membrane lipoprotein [Bacteroidota bacterium]